MHILNRILLWGLALLVASFVVTQAWFFVHIWWWVKHNPPATSFMEQRYDELREKKADARLNQVWAPYGAISDNLKRAVIGAEDSKFADHEGFDWEGIQKALEKNKRKGKIVAGGSTITQQLAKNLFLSGERSWWRKGQEAIITEMLESQMDKQRIFEIYLNVVEWGEGVFGAEAASQHYFGVSASRLSPRQAALMASILPAPRRFEKNMNSAYLQKRTDIITARMPQVELP
jgi:monofunctional biosynthetic peptidoglycan transglycosylase